MQNIDKLRVQNTFARVVKEHSKYDHITSLLSQLNWLPIEARIRHKMSVLTFKAVSTSKPSYVAELISTHTPARELRTSSRRPNQLHVPNVRTDFGSRAFSDAAPAVWNSLPSTVTYYYVFTRHIQVSVKNIFILSVIPLLIVLPIRIWIRRHRRRHMIQFELFIINIIILLSL